MEAQVSRIALQPGKYDEMMAVLRDHGLPVLRAAQGFAGGLWLYDPETLRGLQVAFWKSAEDIARLMASGTGEETGRRLEPLMAELQPPERFTVLHREEMPDAAHAAYAVVVVPPIRAGAQEEAIGVWRAAVLPVLKAEDGFAGAAILLDPTAQQVMDITLWTSDTAMQAAATHGEMRHATERLASYLTGDPTARRYQVVHQEDGARDVGASDAVQAADGVPTPVV